MARPYSLDLRQQILKDYDSGVPIEDLVVHYAVSRSWLYSLIKQRRETGSIAPRTYRPGNKKKLASHEQTVRQVVAEHHDATLVEFCELLAERNIVVSTTTLCNFLRHLKITRKKRLSVPPNGCVPMSSLHEKRGRSSKKSSTSKDSFSSTKPGRKRT